VLLSRGAESPFNTMSPGPRPTSVPNGIFIHPAVCPQQTWAKKWGCAPLGGAAFPCNTMSPGPTSTSLSSGILIHPAIWPQQTRAEKGEWEWCVPFEGELGPHVTQRGLGQGLPSTKWHIDPCSRLATTPRPELGVLCSPPPLWASVVPI